MIFERINFRTYISIFHFLFGCCCFLCSIFSYTKDRELCVNERMIYDRLDAQNCMSFNGITYRWHHFSAFFVFVFIFPTNNSIVSRIFSFFSLSLKIVWYILCSATELNEASMMKTHCALSNTTKCIAHKKKEQAKRKKKKNNYNITKCFVRFIIEANELKRKKRQQSKIEGHCLLSQCPCPFAFLLLRPSSTY